MELLSVSLPASHRIILAGDLHFGTKACYLKGWQAMLDRVAREKRTYLVLMGDLIEAIAVDDFRFDPAVHSGQTPMAQAAEVAAMLRPLRKKILCCLTGNHEMKLFRYGDLTRHICDLAGGIPYGGYSAKIDIRDRGNSIYKMYVTHGRLSTSSNADDPVRRLSNLRLAIKRKLQHLAGDTCIMACGHTHKLLHLEPESHLYLTDDGQHIQARYTQGQQNGDYIDPNLRWYVNTGSFLRSSIIGSTTYSEQAGYAPLQMGYAETIVADGQIQRVVETRIG